MSDRALLPREEREALRRAIADLVDQFGSQAAVGAKLHVSQQAINKAVRFGEVGPVVQRRVLEYLRVTMTDLMDLYIPPPPRPPSSPLPPSSSDPYPSRARAVQAARILGLDAGAIAEVQALALANAEDPGERYWIERIQERDRTARDPHRKRA